MNETSTFDKSFRKSFGWFLLIALAICCLPWIFAKNSWWIDFTDTGQIGDTIGGIMGPFVAIAAAGLTFIAFWVQYKANIQQRQDIAFERFERNFYEMLRTQQEITNGLLIGIVDGYGNMILSHKGRDVFQYSYELAYDKISFPDGEKNCTLKGALRNWPDLRLHLDTVKVMSAFDHYFLHLYRIIKYIDEADSSLIDYEKKYEYSCIVRATLSQFEILLLYYNGFSHPKFKVLIEKYALLNNIRLELMATADEQDLYELKMSEEYKHDEDSRRDMNLEYKKSAFVRKDRLT